MTDITIVSAMSSNYVIGHEGKIPFDLPEDRQFFREYCRNKTLVVGYQTFLGLPKMPDVSVYVLTNKKTKEAYKAYIDKVSRYHGDSPYYQFMTGTLDQFKDLLLSPSYLTGGEIIIGGGAEVYKTFLPFADRCILTQYHAQVDGDTKFPIHLANELNGILLVKKVVYHEPWSKLRNQPEWTRTTSLVGQDGYKRLLVR